MIEKFKNNFVQVPQHYKELFTELLASLEIPSYARDCEIEYNKEGTANVYIMDDGKWYANPINTYEEYKLTNTILYPEIMIEEITSLFYNDTKYINQEEVAAFTKELQKLK